ncbi:uncharacterized mitochondrial protein AtMg00810-like [Andrographis paniculata]|uniref:uncharacterized mitochondrial protein AtMg00810-like n=1 Tax=Andrographis paniculata TaxID=175694 RepID=UPI0021E93B39|nr:uncharacterized mitochondrial protein AtMg00810-like [Andrographis paniculata]
MEMISNFKMSMMEEFDMTDLEELHHFLGIKMLQSKGGIFILQEKYATQLLEKFNMKNANPVSTYCIICLKLSKKGEGKLVNPTLFRSLIGNLMYLTATRPDIIYGVSLLSRFMEKTYSNHWEAAKRIPRYVKGSINLGIFYVLDILIAILLEVLMIHGAFQAMYLLLGVELFHGAKKKQPVVATSTTEAEYIAMALVGFQTLWLR